MKREVFATLMGLSFAVQAWLSVAGAGKLAQKTSSSGGALHPLETYVMVRRVAGVKPGIYHYDAMVGNFRESRAAFRRRISRATWQGSGGFKMRRSWYF